MTNLFFKNIEKQEGKVEFKAPLVVAPPTYNIVDELKAEGDWEVLQKYSGFNANDKYIYLVGQHHQGVLTLWKLDIEK
jgi:aconitase B